MFMRLQKEKVFEKLLQKNGRHIKWIMKENLKKNRLIKTDSEWVKMIESKLK